MKAASSHRPLEGSEGKPPQTHFFYIFYADYFCNLNESTVAAKNTPIFLKFFMLTLFVI